MSPAAKALAGTGVTGNETIHANLLPPALIAHAKVGFPPMAPSLP